MRRNSPSARSASNIEGLAFLDIKEKRRSGNSPPLHAPHGADFCALGAPGECPAAASAPPLTVAHFMNYSCLCHSFCDQNKNHKVDDVDENDILMFFKTMIHFMIFLVLIAEALTLAENNS